MLNPVLKTMYSETVVSVMEKLADDMQAAGRRVTVYGVHTHDSGVVYPDAFFFESKTWEDMGRIIADTEKYSEELVNDFNEPPLPGCFDMSNSYSKEGIDLWVI